jgi:hypothetical protein
MPETEHITVAEVSDGPGGSGTPGTDVTLPVVELLTGRGFVTGKSGSGKSNSASVIAEKLLDNGFGLLIVDIDGEYYGLKEAYEILHVGADEECDIQITTDHAEKVASLALEKNVPIILDVSSFLDDDEAEAVLTAVSRHLFAKAKKQKQPFLVLVEEVHEYIPENGSVGECGKMLIKIGKRGRKHGLGIVGISQRPADVKKDFITQCDWLVWHRLTWDNDTSVVRRVLDGEYATAVESLDDGEGFLMTDWSGSVRRVQFQRKRTFDAGATPGLDDFERPDLKSVSDDLVSELEAISEEKQAREDRIGELRAELDRKNSKIAELEAKLRDAREMQRTADRFVDALVRHVDGSTPGRTEQERMREQRSGSRPDGMLTAEASTGEDRDGDAEVGPTPRTRPAATDAVNGSHGLASAPGTTADDPGSQADSQSAEEPSEATTDERSTDDPARTTTDSPSADDRDGTATGRSGTSGTAGATDSDGGAGTDRDRTNGDGSAGFSAAAVLDRLNAVSETPISDERRATASESTARQGSIRRPADRQPASGSGSGAGRTSGDGQPTPSSGASTGHAGDGRADGTPAADSSDDGTLEADIVDADGDDSEYGIMRDPGAEPPIIEDEEPLVVRELKADVAGFDTRARKMLSFYREFGPGTPLNAHSAAGGDDDRTEAYAHNRTLRSYGLIEHVGRGHYDYRLRDYLAEHVQGDVSAGRIDAYARNVEENALGVAEGE